MCEGGGNPCFFEEESTVSGRILPIRKTDGKRNFKRAGVKTLSGQSEDTVNQEIHVLALVKGEERYVFFYTRERQADLFRTIARYASNPDLSFTWYDAAVLSQRIRRELEQGTSPHFSSEIIAE